MSTTDSAARPEDPVPDGDDNGAEPTATRRPEDEAQERLQRSMADLENLRKRCARQVAEERAAARAETAARWLPLVDNLERAVEFASRTGQRDPVVDGIRAVRDQAVSILESMGFERHAEVRVPFDPYLHEAVGVTHDVDAEPGTVVQVVRAGYGEGERQLRPAGVLVAGPRE